MGSGGLWGGGLEIAMGKSHRDWGGACSFGGGFGVVGSGSCGKSHKDWTVGSGGGLGSGDPMEILRGVGDPIEMSHRVWGGGGGLGPQWGRWDGVVGLGELWGCEVGGLTESPIGTGGVGGPWGNPIGNGGLCGKAPLGSRGVLGSGQGGRRWGFPWGVGDPIEMPHRDWRGFGVLVNPRGVGLWGRGGGWGPQGEMGEKSHREWGDVGG